MIVLINIRQDNRIVRFHWRNALLAFRCYRASADQYREGKMHSMPIVYPSLRRGGWY